MARLAHFLSIGNALLVAAASALLTQHSRLHQGATARVAAFNRAYDDAIRSGDNARVLALWTRDGVSLLPGQAALRGREALATFLAGVQAQAAGWKVITQTSTCHDIEVHGSWATEWCETHQVAARPAGQPNWEGWGKMALILRMSHGHWRIQQEMWNQAPPPPTAKQP